MAQFLKQDAISFDDILGQVNDRLNSDPNLQTLRESAIGQMMVEIFAAVGNLVTYNIDQRAKENYLETARLRSSVILLARQLGYSVTRSIPATARLKLRLTGDFRDQYGTVIFNVAGERIQVPYHSVFTYNGYNFILKKTLNINVTPAMITAMQAQGADYISDYIDVDLYGEEIEIAQGEIKEQIIDGSQNPFIGSKFQTYRVDDILASDVYGVNDYEVPCMRVWVGQTKADDNEYLIDRKCLINWEGFDALTMGEIKKICLVRTSTSEGLEIIFGDNKYAQLGATISGTGAQTTYDNIYIQYLSTNGSEANQTGVVNKKIIYNDKIYTQTLIDITSKVEFYLNSNILGGSEMEDIDSIRLNAPQIYYSLDRLVSKKDYVSFLKTLTSPINVKNALAWGEQEEVDAQRVDAIKELFNIVFFTCIGELYQVHTSPYYTLTGNIALNDSVLDEYKLDDDILDQNYFNVYSKTGIINQLKNYNVSAFRYEYNGAISAEPNISQSYYYTNYGPTAILTVSYTTLYSEYNSRLTGSATFEVDLSDMDGSVYATDDDAMIKIADRITGELQVINDLRGNVQSNLNYNQLAFENVTCEFNTDTKAFNILHGIDDKCYVSNVSGGFSVETGLYTGVVNRAYVIDSVKLNYKIIDVIDKIKDRSQVTTRSVYVSPIIQKFNVVGTVYTNRLSDILTTKTEVEDEIYNWLNINADFNQPIFVSNITDIINSNNSVKYSDIKIIPDKPIPLNGAETFYTSYDEYVTAYCYSKGIDTFNIVYPIYQALQNYLTAYAVSEDISGTNDKNIEIYDMNFVQNYSYTFTNMINERSFWEVLVKDIYNSLVVSYPDFANSTDFMKVINKIHKDFLYAIRFNMLDTNGNIVAEYDSSSKYLKGGYSLGSEIVQLNVKLNYLYK